MSANNLVLLATYWNEIDWIDPSLEQIDLIRPVEAIICDGCFDPTYPNMSTDGTREKIEAFAAQRPWVKMITAKRLTRPGHVRYWFHDYHGAEPRISTLPARLIGLAKLRFHPYRLNQAATFNHMISISENFRPGNWVMTYDCDQFYSDSLLEKFKSLSADTPFDILGGHEYTFFKSFHTYTDKYEARIHNNLPHKIYRTSRFVPTRHLVVQKGVRYREYPDWAWISSDDVYFHYRLRPAEREQAGYALGDRKPPAAHRCEVWPYEGRHPSVIQKTKLAGVRAEQP